MEHSISQQDVSWFLDLYEKEQLDLDPPYQRRSVWTLKDKRFFIDTILNGYPAPPIFLHKSLDERGRVTYHVVDGKQRLQTIIEFSKDKIRIPDDFSNISLQKKKWGDLQRTTKEDFWNYSLIVEMLPNIEEASIRDTFERINRNSRKLERQEIRHAKYDGWFINTVETESEKPEWKKFGIVTSARAKRMSDVQFISELIAINLTNNINGFDQDWLDELYAKYEEPDGTAMFVMEDLLETIEGTKSIFESLLELEPDVMNYFKVLAHFYSLWGLLTLQINENFEPEEFAPAYRKFMDKVSDAIKMYGNDDDFSETEDTVRIYAANSRGASTDLNPRQARHQQLMIALAAVKGITNENC